MNTFQVHCILLKASAIITIEKMLYRQTHLRIMFISSSTWMCKCSHIWGNIREQGHVDLRLESQHNHNLFYSVHILMSCIKTDGACHKALRSILSHSCFFGDKDKVFWAICEYFEDRTWALSSDSLSLQLNSLKCIA